MRAPQRMTEAEFDAYLTAKERELVIIDFFCLPAELENFELTDELEAFIEEAEAFAHQYGCEGDRK